MASPIFVLRGRRCRHQFHRVVSVLRIDKLQNAPIVSIIDDDESVRLAVKSLVRSLGWMAYTFASAEEFLQSPHVDDSSCLITDLQLPGMNGVKLQSLVFSRDPHFPILFTHASPDKPIHN